MRNSKLFKFTFALVASLSLLTISCGDGGAKRNDEPINEFSTNEKIIARALLKSTTTSTQDASDDQSYQFQNPFQFQVTNQNFANRYLNRNFADDAQDQQLDQVLYGLDETVEYVRVPADLTIDETNIDSIFENAERIQVIDNVLASSNFGFSTQEVEDESDSSDPFYNNGFFGTGLQQGFEQGYHHYEDIRKKTIRRVYKEEPVYPQYRPTPNMNYGRIMVYQVMPQTRPSMMVPQQQQVPQLQQVPQMPQMNFPQFANQRWNISEDNTDTSLDNSNQEYYLDDESYYPYSMDESSVTDTDLLLSDNSTCESAEGCFWFTRLDNFSNRFVTEANINTLWDYTAISYRSNTCSSLDCTLAITNERVLTTNSYSYAIYSVQQ